MATPSPLSFVSVPLDQRERLSNVATSEPFQREVRNVMTRMGYPDLSDTMVLLLIGAVTRDRRAEAFSASEAQFPTPEHDDFEGELTKLIDQRTAMAARGASTAQIDQQIANVEALAEFADS